MKHNHPTAQIAPAHILTVTEIEMHEIRCHGLLLKTIPSIKDPVKRVNDACFQLKKTASWGRIHTMDISRKFITKAKDVRTKEMDGRSVVLDLDSGSYFTLNEMGSFIWSLLDGRKDSARIVGDVTGKYKVDAETASWDVIELIRRLEEEGLIRLHDDPQ
jgi:hypothetical protein